MTNETPVEVARHANIPDVLPLDALTLIGVFQSAETMSALVRLPTGDIQRVIPGNRVANRIVTALSDDSMILTDRHGTTAVLTMPG